MDNEDTAGSGGRALRIVGGVDVQIVEPDGEAPVEGGAVGELCLSGATVFPGYADPEDDKGRFLDIEGRRYFRTRDLVRWIEPRRLLDYCGRCDDMAKVGGKWVDTLTLEASIAALSGVLEAKIIATPQLRGAFVVPRPSNGTDLAASGNAGRPLAMAEAIRRELPPGFSTYLLAAEALPRHVATGKVNRQALLRAVGEVDVHEELCARRGRVVSRFIRGYSVLMRFCHHDPRRLICLAYLWYLLEHSYDWQRLQSILACGFEKRGGSRTVLLCLAWALPLPQLQRLAAPGARLARRAGEGLGWVAVFAATFPHWLMAVPGESSKRRSRSQQDVPLACQRAVGSLQGLFAAWKRRPCPSCSGAHVVSLFPSVSHCCGRCAQTGGVEHDALCFRMPPSGKRQCDNCDFEATWDARFCCFCCQKRPRTHGRYCDKVPYAPACAVTTRSDGPEGSAGGGGGWRGRGRGRGDAGGHHSRSPARPRPPRARTRRGAGPAPPRGKQDDALSDGGPEPDVREEAVAALVWQASGEAPEADGDEPGIGEWAPRRPLPPLDSLRALRLLAAVRQELGRSVSLQDLAACRSLDDLVAAVRRAPSASARRFPDPGAAGFRLWTFGWNNCLQWLFRVRHPLDLEAFGAAAARLLGRHPALRLQNDGRTDVHTAYREAGVVLEVLRAAAGAPPAARAVPAAARAIRLLQEALQVSWPRWRTGRPPAAGAVAGPETILRMECPLESLEATAKPLKKKFRPPFQLALFTHPEAACEAEGAAPWGHMCVMLSHAIADGTAVEPVVQDLAALYEDELAAARSRGASGGHRPIRLCFLSCRLPHFGAVLEQRLLHTLAGDTSPDAMYMDRRMDFLEHHFPESRCAGYCQTFHVLPSELRELMSAVLRHVPGCPAELALLSLLAISLARLGGEPRVKLTLVHHGRDSPPGATGIVGFMTDFRTFTVPTSELMSLLGVVHFVFASVRERAWRRPEALEQIATLVNIVPSSFSPAGPFTQAQWMGTSWAASPDGALSQWGMGRSLRRPLEFQIEQVDAEQWTVNMYVDEVRYPAEAGRRFRACWARALRDLREDPLRGVLGGRPEPPPAYQPAAAPPRPGRRRGGIRRVAPAAPRAPRRARCGTRRPACSRSLPQRVVPTSSRCLS
ncbi:unnamed protein product [Prorocentrum cordatum]|uniref:Carrier domain-containing protein n=1 Tax=Prorocentrum cordatum TaxID=2364126 RepID=A0ABN9RLY2_9DINO|nr:unnamed protein product [Polarella glacialis]